MCEAACLTVFPSCPQQLDLLSEESSPALDTHIDSCALAGDGLLALKTGWTNWEVFAEENQVLGWNQSLDVCEWTGVYCLNNSGTGRVFWLCATTPLVPCRACPCQFRS